MNRNTKKADILIITDGEGLLSMYYIEDLIDLQTLKASVRKIKKDDYDTYSSIHRSIYETKMLDSANNIYYRNSYRGIEGGSEYLGCSEIQKDSDEIVIRTLIVVNTNYVTLYKKTFNTDIYDSELQSTIYDITGFQITYQPPKYKTPKTIGLSEF